MTFIGHDSFNYFKDIMILEIMAGGYHMARYITIT